MRRAVLAASLFVTAPAAAKVDSAQPNGFALSYRIDLAVPPAAAYRHFVDLKSWWNKDHTYSGDAANLSLDERVGGCWCERLQNGGGVEHMRVVYIDPGRAISLSGGLGPLSAEGVAGSLQARFIPAGQQSTLVLTYRVAGFARGNGKELAPAVDAVLAAQLRNFAATVRP